MLCPARTALNRALAGFLLESTIAAFIVSGCCRRRNMRRGNRSCGVVLAAATGMVLGAIGHCWAGIAYDTSSRITVTHDADVSNLTDPKFSTGRIPVPKSIDVFPVNPYQMDHTFTSGSANSIATG